MLMRLPGHHALIALIRTMAALGALLWSLTVHADVDIDIPDTTDAIENNVRAFLSLTRYEDRDDISPEVMARLQRRITPEVRKALQPLGYYAPEVSHEVTRLSDRNWRVVIRVAPGRPVRISEVTIEVTGAGRNDRAIAAVIARRELKPGLRLNHGRYDRVKGALLRAAVNNGYLDARYTQSDLIIDRNERRSWITLRLQTGERYRFGTINIVQDVIDDRAMQRLLRMRTGDPYTLDALLRTQYVLDDTQYFSAAEIENGEPEPSSRTVPITIRAAQNRRNRYGVSVGYATDTRARGRFIWDNRLVNRSGHRLQAQLTGSQDLQEAAVRYVVPVMDVALEKLEFSLAGTEEELGDALSQRVEFSAGLTQVIGKWQRVLFTRLLNENSKSDIEDKTEFLIIPGIRYATMPPYLVGESTRHYAFHSELTGSPSTLGSDASYLQLRMQGERVFNLSELWHVRLRGEVGMTWVDTGQVVDLPVSQRFYAGGDRSVRGFGLNELPLVDAGENIGSKHLATSSLELERDLPRNFRVAAFYDAGNAFNDFADVSMEYSAGLGLRYQIAVASLGIDVAQALSQSGRSPRLHLHFSTVF